MFHKEGYKIIVMSDLDSTSTIFSSDSYDETFSGKEIALQLNNPKKEILIRMIPEFLFAFLLFSVISFAFIIIYRNLQNERRLTDLKNNFISNITHELKTPITTVGVAIEALGSFNALQNPATTKEYLDISKLELNRLSILVDKVLKMSLFEQKEPELKMEIACH